MAYDPINDTVIIGSTGTTVLANNTINSTSIPGTDTRLMYDLSVDTFAMSGSPASIDLFTTDVTDGNTLEYGISLQRETPSTSFSIVNSESVRVHGFSKGLPDLMRSGDLQNTMLVDAEADNDVNILFVEVAATQPVITMLHKDRFGVFTSEINGYYQVVPYTTPATIISNTDNLLSIEQKTDGTGQQNKFLITGTGNTYERSDRAQYWA